MNLSIKVQNRSIFYSKSRSFWTSLYVIVGKVLLLKVIDGYVRFCFLNYEIPI